MKRLQHKRWWTLLGLVLTLLGCSGSGGDSNREADAPDRVSVSGTVMDIDGDPVVGALVAITRTGSATASPDLGTSRAAVDNDRVVETTDSQGVFVALVVPGSHTIRIRMGAAEIHTASFTCGADTPMDLGTIETGYDPATAMMDNDEDGYSPNAGDCDDSDAGIHPGVSEVCDDGRDNDCDWETDCEDADCADAPSCGNGNGNAGVLWILPYDPEVPVATFQHAGGVAVGMIYYLDFRATGASGKLQLAAAVKADPGDAASLAERVIDVSVQAGQTYTLVTTMAVSSWGRCNPDEIDTIVVSSPAAARRHSFDIFPFMDPDTNWYECIGRYAISEMRIEATEAAVGSPMAGYWEGAAGFGELEMRLGSHGTRVNQVRLNFQNFSCGEVEAISGSMTITPEEVWPIEADAFSILLPLSRTLDREMRLQGRFAHAGTTASGAYTADFNGTLCTGTWTAAPRQEID
jgi:hypothetical protein